MSVTVTFPERAFSRLRRVSISVDAACPAGDVGAGAGGGLSSCFVVVGAGDVGAGAEGGGGTSATAGAGGIMGDEGGIDSGGSSGSSVGSETDIVGVTPPIKGMGGMVPL